MQGLETTKNMNQTSALRSVPEFVELQRDLESLELLENRDRFLKVIPALTGDADPVALDRALRLDLRVLDRLPDLARDVGIDALLEEAPLLPGRDRGSWVRDVHAHEVVAAL